MTGWLRAHVDAFADALSRLVAAPLGSLLALLATGIALALPAGGLILLDNLQRMTGGLADTQEISLFLATDASRAEVQEIERRLAAAGGLAFRFVGKDAALKELQTAEKLGDLLAGLPRNPLPDAFVIRPAGKSAAELATLARTLAAWPRVAHVQLDSAWVERLDAFVRFGRRVVLTLGAVLAAGLVAVVFNTLRLQVIARRSEVEVALLIGATRAFVARPFLWFGVLQGALGGLLATALLGLALARLAGPAEELIALYGGGFQLRLLTPQIAVGLPAAGALLGWLAARLSTRALGDG